MLCCGESQDDFERRRDMPTILEGLYNGRIVLFHHLVGKFVKWIQLDEYSLKL